MPHAAIKQVSVRTRIMLHVHKHQRDCRRGRREGRRHIKLFFGVDWVRHRIGVIGVYVWCVSSQFERRRLETIGSSEVRRQRRCDGLRKTRPYMRSLFMRLYSGNILYKQTTIYIIHYYIVYTIYHQHRTMADCYLAFWSFCGWLRLCRDNDAHRLGRRKSYEDDFICHVYT